MSRNNPTMSDATTERWLDSHLVHFHLETIGLDRIQTRASHDNQARIVPVDEDLVERYRRHMDNGTIFPALVGYERAGRVVLIDGNHRHEAMTRCHWATETDIYLVDANASTAVILTYLANERNGMPNAEEERLLHAMHLVESGLVRNSREAAAMLGINRPNKITDAIAERKARERAKELGIRATGSLSSSALTRLAGIRSDPAFEAATRLAIAAKMPLVDINTLAREINAARSDGAQLRVVEEAAELHKTLAAAPPQESGKQKRSMPRWAQAKGHLKGLLLITPDEVKTTSPSPEVWEDMRTLIQTVVDHLATFDAS